MAVAPWRPVLHRIIGLGVVGLLAVGCQGDDSSSNGDCAVTHETKTITTPEPAVDPGLQFKIDSCRADADACPTLCALAMTQAGLSFNNGDVTNGEAIPLPPGSGGGTFGGPVTPTVNCDVTFEDSQVSMVVKYDVYTNTLGCPVDVGNTDGQPIPQTGGGL
jgi:hypothetical protein